MKAANKIADLGTKVKDSIALSFILILLGTLGISYLIHDAWVKEIQLYHTVLELACVFIAFSIFVSIWHSDGKGSLDNLLLALGFLAVGFFDTMHSFYYLKLNLTPAAYSDLSTYYWIISRLTEAAILLVTIRSVKMIKKRSIGLLITVGVVFGISYSLIAFHDYLPILLNDKGVTPFKKFLEYVVICIHLLSLYSINDQKERHGNLSFKFINLSLLISISSELCFTMYISTTNPVWTVGHVFKVISYYFLFRGVFISVVTYPYRQLEIKNNSLEEAYQELNRMSETVSDILNALPIGVLKFDKNGSVKYVNRNFYEQVNGDVDIRNRSISDIGREYAASYEGRVLDKKILEAVGTSTLVTYPTLNGELQSLSVRPHKIKNGTLLLINESKKEQELQNLHIQTETILNSISSGVLMMGCDKKIILCNRAFAEILEIDKESVIGMNIDELNEMINFKMQELPQQLQQDRVNNQESEAEIFSLQGKRKDISLYVATIKNVDDEVIGTIIVANDITEIKKEQQKVLQQEKLALLGQMGAGIVHETRNFLTTIKGRCQLIGIAAQDEHIRSHAEKISKDVDEVNRIISEFLFLSKPRETELLEISINDIFESIKGMIETSSLVRGVNIEFLLCKEERYLLCDEAQLKQVILNICKNAIDAMSEQRDAKLIVRTGFDEEHNEVFISIQDNGKGIAQEDLKKIGTPFFTTKSNGTGLGLSVCYNIIKEHKGRIEVQSEKEKGTIFTVVLPCIKDEDLEMDI